MRNQTNCLILITIIVTTTLTKTEEELFQEYKYNQSQDQMKITPEQKQCIYLKKFFEALPEESNLVSELPSFFKKLFTTPVIKLNTFENWAWVIMLELMKMTHATEPREIKDFEAWTRIKNKLVKEGSENGSSLVFMTDNMAINRFKNNRPNSDRSDRTIFESIYELYSGVISELNETLLMEPNSKNLTEEQINKNLTEITELTMKIKDKYTIFRKEVVSFEKERNSVQEYMNTLGDSRSLIQDANDFKKFIDFIDNLKNYPSPDGNKQNVENNVDSNPDPLAEINNFLNKATSYGADLTDNGIVKNIIDVKNLYSSLKEQKETMDREKIFISYKKLLKEGENKDYHDKEERRNLYENNIKEYNSKMNDLISKLKGSIERSQKFLSYKNKPSIKYLEGDYNNHLKHLKDKKKNIKKQNGEIKDLVIDLKRILMTRKLLEMRQKRLDFVFPNNVFIDLQLELENAKKTTEYIDDVETELLEMQLEGLKSNLELLPDDGVLENTLAIKEVQKYIDRMEQQIKINKMIYVIELLHIRNDINEIMSRKMGRVIGRLQNMINDKKCFSLPDVSLYIFKLMKTNMIHFEKYFLTSFLSIYPDFEKKKKFVLYNYMVSNNREYGLKAIKILETETTEEKRITYIENFTVNFTLLVTIIRDKTTFSRNEISTKINAMELAKNIFSMINIDMQKKIEEKTINKILKKLNAIILTVFPFLNLIPFIKKILKKIEKEIFKGVLYLIKKLVTATGHFIKELSSNRVTTRDYDFNKIMLNLDDVITADEEKLDFEVIMDTMKEIEVNYKRKSEGNNFDFTLFDSSDNFVFNMNIDIFRLNDKEYLKENGMPDFGLTKGNRII